MVIGCSQMRLLTHPDIDIGDHAQAFDKVRAAIERDDFRSADVKKLASSDLHRAKLDYDTRLIVKFVRSPSETVCLALEIVEGHAYDRSRFLRGAVVDERVVELGPLAAPPDAVTVPYIHPTRTTFHFLDRPLSFDDAQDAVHRLRPPALVVGTAGGGKTAIALAKIRDIAGDVLYVTQSPYLADTARTLYGSHGYENEAQKVDFLSFEDLLASTTVPEGQPVSFRAFAGWYVRQKTSTALGRAGAHACFEEIRGVITSPPDGPLSLEAYSALGVKQSIFPVDERGEVYAIYTKYLAWLSETRQYEPNLVAHRYLPLTRERYDFAVVDEAQDLTNVQLTLVLRTLRTKDAFVLLGDANQIVHPNFFSWSAVKTMLMGERAQAVEVLALNYRNARAVTDASNALLKIKHARFGSIDRESNLLAEPASREEGSVVVLPATPAVVADLDRKIAASTDFAVIVLRDEDKPAARKHFRTPLLFSVREAKGLEYPNVVVYDIVSGEPTAFRDICDGVTEDDLRGAELTFRRSHDKRDKSLERYKFFVNALYVAVTRGMKNVYLVERDVDHQILGLFGAARAADAGRVEGRKSSMEEWQREAGKLEAQGKTEQAEAIRTNILHEAKVPWDVFDQSHWRRVAEKALAPNSIHTKAKQQLLEVAAFHQVRPVFVKLLRQVAAARSEEDVRGGAHRRHVQPYAARNVKDVLWQTERYGVDFRNPLNLTPLMLAALAGNVGLVEDLIARGARRDSTDTFGWMAVHWAIDRAYADEPYARGPFGAVYDRIAPASVDFLVGDRLVKVGREQGEYFVVAAMIASMRRLYSERVRIGGVTARDLTRGAFGAFPSTVVAHWRQKRTYVNAVLARSETVSKYVTSRQLWVREAHGHYVPSPHVRVRDASSWIPLYKALGVDLFDAHLTFTGSGLGLLSRLDDERDAEEQAG